MNNAADKSIVAAIMKFPDIPDEEAKQMAAKIRDPHCRRAVQAHLGEVEFQQLNEVEKRNYYEIRRWADSGAVRIHNEQQWHRIQGKESKFAAHLKGRNQKGSVGPKLLQATGIEGKIRKRQPPLTQEQKDQLRIAAQSLRRNLGRYIFDDDGTMYYREYIHELIDWKQEGF